MYPNTENLIEFIATQNGKEKLRPDHKMAVMADMITVKNRYYNCKKLLECLRIF